MVFAALAKLKKNSVPTTLSAGVTAVSTTIPVTELSRFYDADGTLILKGIVIGGDNANSIIPEEITITGASGTSGAGNLTGATRGVNADGTIGAGYAWPSGTNIAATFSTGIYNQIKDNFTECFLRDGTVKLTGSNFYRSVDNSYLGFKSGSAYDKGAYFNMFGKDHATTPSRFEIFVLNSAGVPISPFYFVGMVDAPTPVFMGLKRGATSVADGGTITHGCGTTPIAVVCTPSVSGEMVSVTALGATTFTVAIKKHDNSAGTTQTVYWIAWV